jgi:hypothetical protein
MIILLLLVAVSASAQTTDSVKTAVKDNRGIQLSGNGFRVIMVDGKKFNGDITKLDTNHIIDVRILRSSASIFMGV